MLFQKLMYLLGNEWQSIIQGIENGIEFHIIHASENCQHDWQDWELIKNQNKYLNNHPMMNIDKILWKKIIFTNEHGEGFQNKINDHDENINVSMNSNSSDEFCIESEGMFLCLMKNQEYGFFNARNGSCGYNACPVGGSYANLYIGTYDNICNFGMDNEARRWNKILGGYI